MQLIMDRDMVMFCAQHSRSPVLRDEELELWADYYQQEPVLRGGVYFDLFISDPRRYCARFGVPPFPGHAGALPDFLDMRPLRREQRLVMGRTI